MKIQRWLAIFLAMTWLMTAQAVDRYVSPYGTNDAAGGYTNWSGAATSVIAAVTAAAASETIRMTNGVFVLTNVLTIDSAKTLRSVNGRDLAIINGSADGWGTAATTGYYIKITSGTFEGITISNGYRSGGAGGIALTDGSIISSKITQCSGRGIGGIGGVAINGAAVMTNCIIQYNWGEWNAGGVLLSTKGEVNNCTIQNNWATFLGAGMTIYELPGNHTLIANCIIRNNTNAATYGGGAGLFLQESGTVRNCLIVSNYGYNAAIGGGVYINNAKRYYAGSGLYNCTVAHNASTAGGGGIYFDAENNNDTVYNCIIYSNYADLAHTIPNDVAKDASVYTNMFLYSCLTNSSFFDRNCITNNPLFVDWTGVNYRLHADSPCINTGTNQEWMTNAVDLDGQTRMRYGAVDMGAYEHIQSGTIYAFH